MKKLGFEIQIRDEDPVYYVRLLKDEDNLTITCTCQQCICIHIIVILTKDAKFIVSSNYKELIEVDDLIAGTDVEPLLHELKVKFTDLKSNKSEAKLLQFNDIKRRLIEAIVN